jgi:hypothetical protein
MVLVQEDDLHDKHVIYYLIQSLMTTEAKYLHVEKLALAVVQAIQRFCHYILLCKTTIIFNCNPMQHILTCQFLGGKYSKWIVILQEFDLEFERAKSKKSLVFSNLYVTFPTLRPKLWQRTPYQTNPFFLSSMMMLGMETLSFIFRLKLSLHPLSILSIHHSR